MHVYAYLELMHRVDNDVVLEFALNATSLLLLLMMMTMISHAGDDEHHRCSLQKVLSTTARR